MRLLGALLVCTLMLSAQTRRPVQRPAAAPAPKATEGQEWPIAKLSVEGNQAIPEDRILAVAGLKVGQRAGKAEFEAARDRLLATGLFETVGYRFGPAPGGGSAYTASFQVVEVSQLFPYRFEALNIDHKALREYLRAKEPLLGDKIPGTQPILDRMARAVEDFLRSQGGSQTVVGKLAADGSGQLAAVFLPKALPSVAEVHFRGNQLIPASTLQQKIAGAAVGAVYTENRFRQILEASIRPLYEAQGRLRVQFPRIETAPAKDVTGIIATVTVSEGPEYKLRKVAVSGASSRNASLLKEGNFHTNDTVNYAQVQAGVEEIAQAMRREGYIHVKTKAERTIDDAAKAVDVVVQVEPGPQFKMGTLAIEGLDIETEPHVRKLWAMKTGQPFNAEYPDYFLGRLRSDELFDNLGKTQSLLKTDAESGTVDVTLKIASDGKPKPRIGPQDPRQQRQQRPEGSAGPPF